MSSKKSAPPLQIDLVPSVTLLALLLFIHGGALLLTEFFDCAASVKLLIVVLLLTSAVLSLHKSGWNRFVPRGIARLFRWQFFPLLVWQGNNTWQITAQNGRCVSACLLPSSTCHRAFVALNFRTEERSWWNRRLSVVIFPDAIDHEIFRQLRARLHTRYVRELEN